MAGHSHHGAGCGCDDDAHQQVEGTQDFLFSKVDRDRVVALNAVEGTEGKVVIKPWDQRNDESEFLESDADEQIILHIPFTGSIKLRSILVKGGPAGHTPDKLKIVRSQIISFERGALEAYPSFLSKFANQTLDFDEATSTDVTQELDIAVTRDPVEYALRPAKFPAVQSLTLFFPSNQGEDTTRINFVGFKGEYSPLTRDPIITVYEAQANPADHAKIPGLDSTAHSRIG
ncbi:DUF1000-domain-containing protein [Meredithblackwellia eburnea MCA 4105]